MCEKKNVYCQHLFFIWKRSHVTTINKNTVWSLTAIIVHGSWIEYYGKILTEDREEFQNVNNERDDFSLCEEDEITPEEVMEKINKMKNGKASGPEGVPVELLKYDPEKLFQLLAYTFNLFLRGE